MNNNTINPNFIVVVDDKPKNLILGDSKDKDPFQNVSFQNMGSPVIVNSSQIRGTPIDYQGNKVGVKKYDFNELEKKL